MPEKLTDDEIQDLLAFYVSRADGNTELREHRLESMQRYMTEDYGNEDPGKTSSVKTSEYREAVEWAVANLLDPFADAENIAEFVANSSEDIAEAQEITDYSNYVFSTQNRGLIILQQMFRDALMFRTGFTKTIWQDETQKLPEQTFKDLSDDMYTLATSHPDIEITAHTKKQSGIAPTVGEDGKLLPITPTHDVTVREVRKQGRIVIENVPPEEIIITDDARFDLKTGGIKAKFIGQRHLKTVSDLIEMGFDEDIVKDAATAENVSSNYTQLRSSRLRGSTTGTLESDIDVYSRSVWIVEGYFRADADGDAYAELLHVIVLGEKGTEDLLLVEEVEEQPFSAITPILVANALFGVDYFDLTAEYQKIKTTLVRQILDNIYRSNAPRHFIREDSVDMDQYTNHTPYGYIFCENPGQDVIAETIPFTAGQLIPLLPYFDQVIEDRTGVGRNLQTLDPKLAQSTSPTVAAMQETAAQKKLKLVVKTASETGIRHIFYLIKHLAKKYQQTAVSYQTQQRSPAQANPQNWNPASQHDISIAVIIGNKDTNLVHLNALLQIQIAAAKESEAMGLPPRVFVDPTKFYNTFKQIVKNSGLKYVDFYFNNPSSPQAQQALQQQKPKQDPKVQEAQAKLQIQAQSAKQDAALSQAQMQQDLQMQQAKMQQEAQLAQQKMQIDMQLERERQQMDAILSNQELQQEAKLKLIQSIIDAHLDVHKTAVSANLKQQTINKPVNGDAQI